MTPCHHLPHPVTIDPKPQTLVLLVTFGRKWVTVACWDKRTRIALSEFPTEIKQLPGTYIKARAGIVNNKLVVTDFEPLTQHVPVPLAEKLTVKVITANNKYRGIDVLPCPECPDGFTFSLGNPELDMTCLANQCYQAGMAEGLKGQHLNNAVVEIADCSRHLAAAVASIIDSHGNKAAYWHGLVKNVNRACLALGIQ